MQDVDAKLDELKKHIENSLETKMNEYTILTDKRDEDLSLLKSEFIELEKEMKERGSASVYSEVVYIQKHYPLAHLLENGHALQGGGRAQAFPHIAPVAEEAANTLLDTIKKHIKQS